MSTEPPEGWNEHSEGQVRFAERRPLSWTFLSIVAAVTLGLVAALVQQLQSGKPLGAVLPVLLLVALGAFVLVGLIALGPVGVERKHIRVDDAGLRLGRKLLPANEIGRCEILPHEEALAAARRSRHRDVKVGVGQTNCNFFAHSGPAVFIVQRRPGMRRPGWLIATRDPERLVAALHALRLRSGGGR